MNKMKLAETRSPFALLAKPIWILRNSLIIRLEFSWKSAKIFFLIFERYRMLSRFSINLRNTLRTHTGCCARFIHLLLFFKRINRLKGFFLQSAWKWVKNASLIIRVLQFLCTNKNFGNSWKNLRLINFTWFDIYIIYIFIYYILKKL